MKDLLRNRIVEEIANQIDIPDTAYEKANARYKDVGDWFNRPDAKSFPFKPHIYSQGSFRLGTVVRPVNSKGSYDLDLGCRLRSGITKLTHTQKQLKQLVGSDIEEYRIARGIIEHKEEKHRCWRLHYSDSLNFHMDAVPSIPESSYKKQLIQEAMIKTGLSEQFAINITNMTGSITDNRLSNYDQISNDWKISNSEGYARWFESRMRLARLLLEKRAIEARKAQIDELPSYQWRSPLQRCVQILKRHRDVMFADNPNVQPISIIITTLAGLAYTGETEIVDALNQILTTMVNLVKPNSPRVANPVNPLEDFADKWTDPQYSHLKLEYHFRRWIAKALSDFQNISDARDINLILEQAQKNFALTFKSDELSARLGLVATGSLLKQAATPSGLSFPPKPLTPKKPAGFA